jgi:hypothetical protein
VEWTGNSFKALTALADSECARFTVLTCERELAALTRFYQSVKTPLVDQVICQINSPEMVTADDRRTRFFIPVSSEAIMPEAVRVLTEMVEGGRRAHYQELDAEIEPPH